MKKLLDILRACLSTVCIYFLFFLFLLFLRRILNRKNAGLAITRPEITVAPELNTDNAGLWCLPGLS